ncbi:MAG: flavodoxin family protein [Candidatus Helarchaeota archaeon]
MSIEKSFKNKIRILGISGSPRIGSTDYIVNYALDYAKEKFNVETDYFSVCDKKINFCIHCDFCVKNKKGCIFKDDMTELYEKLKLADAYIIASPVYQGNVSGQLKTVFDRCRALVAGNPKVFENKVGIALAVGGDRIGGQEPTIRTILDFYIINEIIGVSGGSWGANLGGTIWSKDKGAEGASHDEEGLRSIRKTIRKLVSVIKYIKRCDE